MEDCLVLATVVTSLMTLLLIFNWWYRRLRLGDLESRYVLITGCDTGFGARCARKMDKLGLHVFAACLTHQAMGDLRGCCSDRLVPVHMDVTKDDTIARALETVKQNLPEARGLWSLINNAGVTGPISMCEWLKKEDYMPSLTVNILGMAAVTNAFLPLIRREQGRIINTASVLGRFAIPAAPYSVSKFCVEGYTDCLRRDLLDHGVTVHTVEPGGYQTNITDFDPASRDLERTFKELSPELQQFYGEGYFKTVHTTIRLGASMVSCPRLDEVVDTYIHTVVARYPKTRYVVGLNANLMFRPLWTMPTWLADFFVGMAFPKPQGMK